MGTRRTRDTFMDDILIPQAIGTNKRLIDPKREFNSANTLEHILDVMIPDDDDDLVCYLETLYIILNRIIGTGFKNEGINMSDESTLNRIKRALSLTESRLFELMLLRSEELRFYTLKIASGKWCTSSTIFICICSIRILLLYINGWNRIEISYPSFIEKGLLLFNKKLNEFTQVEIWNQCVLLSEKWRNIEYFEELGKFTYAILDEVSLMCVDRNTRTRIDWEDESMSISIGDNTHVVSKQYVDDMSCFFEDFILTIKIDEMIKAGYRPVAVESVEKVKRSSLFLLRWLEGELENVADEKFKMSMLTTCLFSTLYPGEMALYNRDSGVETESPLLILQHTRTPMEVNWWAKEGIPVKGSVKVEHDVKSMKNIMAFYLFAKYIKSLVDLDWIDEVLFSEKKYLENAKEILTRDDPLILCHMGVFKLLYKQNVYSFYEPEEAIFYWIHLISLNDDCIFTGKNESWELDDIVAQITTALKRNESDIAIKEKKIPKISKDSVFYYQSEDY